MKEEEGDVCNEILYDGTKCSGRLELKPVKNCSCHISPPCHEHENPKLQCPLCGWEES